MESPDFGLLGKVTTAVVSTTAALGVAAAAGAASRGQEIATGLSAMASATPTGVDAVSETASSISTPALPSIAEEVPLNCPNSITAFSNSIHMKLLLTTNQRFKALFRMNIVKRIREQTTTIFI